MEVPLIRIDELAIKFPHLHSESEFLHGWKTHKRLSSSGSQLSNPNIQEYQGEGMLVKSLKIMQDVPIAVLLFFVLGILGQQALSEPNENPKSGAVRGHAMIRSEGKVMRITTAGKSVNDASHERRSVYASLQETCKKWTNWYKRDRDKNSAVHMNISCREAAEYAKTQLNIDTGMPNYVALSTVAEDSSIGNATLIGVPDDSGSPKCKSLQRQKKAVEAKLRNGYKVGRGERLKQRRRDIRDQMREVGC